MTIHFSMPLSLSSSPPPWGRGTGLARWWGRLSIDAGSLRCCHRQAGHPCPTPLPVAKSSGLAIRIRFPPTRLRLNEAPSG